MQSLRIVVNEHGLKKSDGRKEAISNMPKPATDTQLCSFFRRSQLFCKMDVPLGAKLNS